MEGMHKRTARLLGEAAMNRLKGASVMVAGLGGVGGSCALALARGGIGNLMLIDGDTVDITNLNRQALAYRSTLGRPKAEAAFEQVQDIDPQLCARAVPEWIDESNARTLIEGMDFVIDAIDDVPAKIALAVACRDAGIFLVSAMGAGNRLDPSRFRITDIAKTHTDPLARSVRSRLRKVGIEHLPVCWSDETPVEILVGEAGERFPASCSFVPPAAGLVIAGYVIRELARGTQG